MIQSQALLQRERGVEGTTLPDVIEHSGAPRGSIYHHFPDGRAQLAAEATEWAADFVSTGLERSLADGDVSAALDRFIEAWETTLTGSDFAAGCPVTAAALDSSSDPGARDAAAAGFRRWESLLREAFVADGISEARAEALAVTFISATEGAIVLARSESSTRPLERVAAELRKLIALEMEEANP